MFASRPFAALARQAARSTPAVTAPAVARRAAPSYAGYALVALVATTAAGAGAYAYEHSELRAALPILRDSYTIQCDAAQPQSTTPAPPADAEIDPATQTAHPHTLTPASAPALTLLGVGVRTVSFLSFKVYSAGLYANDFVLRTSAALPAMAGYDANTGLNGEEGEKRVAALLGVPGGSVAVRIVPVRNTDFAHLRDGFTRTLLARQRTQRQAGTLSPDKDEAITTAIQQLKSLFPAGSVPKGRELVIVRTPDEQLAVEYEGKVMGRVADAWVADNMVLAYFDAKSPISPPLRDSVAQGLGKYF